MVNIDKTDLTLYNDNFRSSYMLGYKPTDAILYMRGGSIKWHVLSRIILENMCYKVKISQYNHEEWLNKMQCLYKSKYVFCCE